MTKKSNRVVSYCSALSLLLAVSACGSHEDTANDKAALNRALTSGVVGNEVISYRLRQSLASIGSTPVVLANGRKLRVDRAAEMSLSRHRQLASEVNAAGAVAALLAPPSTSEEFIETERTAILIATTSMTVKDPALLRGSAPLLGKFRMKGMGALKLDQLSADQRAQFDRFEAEMLTKPKTHPLGLAARRGGQALLDAVLSGKGDLVITTKVEVPLDGLKTTTSGSYDAPSFSSGAFNYSRTQPQHIPGFGSGLPTFADEDSGIDIEAGSASNVTQFVNGFTEADAFEWTERWDFGIGHVELEAGASYGIGLRIPVEVRSTMTPTTIAQYGGTSDSDSTFDTSVAVDVIDADEDFYESAGLPADEIQDGKELVLNAEAHLTIEVDLLGVADVDITQGTEVDFGEHFKPPFGDCGTDCGLDFWLPADLTRTQIDGGVAGANAQIGFNVSGDGEVELDYESLYDGEGVPSALGAGDDEPKHVLKFTRARERNLHTSLEALAEKGSHKPFGYELSDVDYTWNVAITPGIKGDVWVDCGILQWEAQIRPFWLDFAEVDLGSLEFGTHAGSRFSRRIVRGEKKWTQFAATAADANPAVSADAASAQGYHP